MQTRSMPAAQRVAARWIPTGGQPETIEALGVVVWRYTVDDGRAAACVYIGTSARPAWNGPFPSVARREAYIEAWKQQLEREQGMRAGFREEREKEVTQFFNGLTVGTVFYLTGGYDQTNAQFYEVVGPAKAHSVPVRELRQTRIESAPMSMSGHAVPRQGEYASEVINWRSKKGRIPKIWEEGVKVSISWYA